MLLAICTWSLNPLNTPLLTDEMRQVLLLSARIFFPGLFAIAVAFVVPTFDRMFQMTTVAVVYVGAIILILDKNEDILTNPIICVVAAVSSLLALLPYNNGYYNSMGNEESFINSTRRFIVASIFTILLPIVTLIFAFVCIRQIDIFIIYTLDETFGQSFLSVIYVPIYLLLQTLGFHDLVGELITTHKSSHMVTAFVNTIILTNLFSLPATIFIRSLFTKRHIRLFLTLLVVICILTSSIGSCVSLTLLLLLIFYPGAFSTLLLSSMVCFGLSYFMDVPPITTVDNLYLPDITLASARMFLAHDTNTVAILESFAIFIPVMMVLVTMLISREKGLIKRSKMRSMKAGYSVNPLSSPELTVLAYLRSLGGISNIADVEEDGEWVYIQVVKHDLVSLNDLNNLVLQKVLIDRINKLYLCDVGEQSHFIYQRLIKLMDNRFGEADSEVPLSTPFKITPMPYAKARITN